MVRELVPCSQLLTQHAGAKPVCSTKTDQGKQVLWQQHAAPNASGQWRNVTDVNQYLKTDTMKLVLRITKILVQQSRKFSFWKKWSLAFLFSIAWSRMNQLNFVCSPGAQGCSKIHSTLSWIHFSAILVLVNHTNPGNIPLWPACRVGSVHSGPWWGQASVLLTPARVCSTAGGAWGAAELWYWDPGSLPLLDLGMSAAFKRWAGLAYSTKSWTDSCIPRRPFRHLDAIICWFIFFLSSKMGKLCCDKWLEFPRLFKQ